MRTGWLGSETTFFAGFLRAAVWSGPGGFVRHHMTHAAAPRRLDTRVVTWFTCYWFRDA